MLLGLVWQLNLFVFFCSTQLLASVSFSQVAASASSQFLLVSAQLEQGSQEQGALLDDWNKACEMVFTQVQAKLFVFPLVFAWFILKVSSY